MLDQVRRIHWVRPHHVAARQRRSSLVWRLAGVSGIVLLISTAAYPLLPREYAATAEILLRPTNSEGATNWDQSVRFALDDNAIQSKIDILRSPPLQRHVITQNNLLNDPEFNPALHPSWLRQQAATHPWLASLLSPPRSADAQVEDNLVRKLTVLRERKSYVLQISYASVDADKTALLTNALMEGFLADQIGRKRALHYALLVSLSARIKTLDAQYKDDEQAEHAYLMASGLIDRSEKDSLNKQVEVLSKAVAEAHQRTVEAVSRADMLAAAQQSNSLGNTNEALNSLLLQRLQQRFVELSTGAGSGNVPAGVSQPVLGFLVRAIEAETLHLVKAAQNQATVAAHVEQALRAEINRINARLVQRQNAERHAEDLHRAVSISLQALTGTIDRSMQEAGRGDVLQPDVEIVAPATAPDRPSFPNKLLYGAGTLAIVVLLNALLLLPTLMRATARAR